MDNNSRSRTTVISHLLEKRVDTALWITRLLTITFSLMFLLPFLGGNPTSSYQRTLLSNGATCALRLHQRLPPFQLSTQFLATIIQEDSGHYLFYSMIFLLQSPITLSLTPVFLFALLHATKFTKDILDRIGPNSLIFLRNLITKIESSNVPILRFIAMNEILLMPIVTIMVFVGQASLLTPILYYRFLTMRYASSRNPYSRQLFWELRVATQQFSSSANCPSFLRNFIDKVISGICRLAPTMATTGSSQ